MYYLYKNKTVLVSSEFNNSDLTTPLSCSTAVDAPQYCCVLSTTLLTTMMVRVLQNRGRGVVAALEVL